MYTAPILLFVGVALCDLSSHESVEVLRDERVAPHDNGAHNMHLELSNGVELHLGGEDGNMIGSYSYVMDDGSVVPLKFVADEGGFQPESSILPVAPAFPHPIPKFVMDQIEFAERQRALRARNDSDEE
ncbi:unnamed protein product [Meganyctiphanes norvegica]|uniref:Uncharacterized protein n=1 Tax=Meganyctiphanes norvegica TaxID=48144 RepID=A0AAV2PY74_MEGNR